MLHGSAARRYTDLRKIGEFLKCCIYEEKYICEEDVCLENV